jgi:hypothetical protein
MFLEILAEACINEYRDHQETRTTIDTEKKHCNQGSDQVRVQRRKFPYDLFTGRLSFFVRFNDFGGLGFCVRIY